MTTARTLEFSNLLPIINVVSANGTNNTAGTIQVTTNDQGVSALKGLIEPLPASALKGLIKIEPPNTANPTAASTSNHQNYGFIKVEQPDAINSHVDCIEGHGSIDQINPVFSPLSLGSSSMASPGSPNSNHSGGGKIKGSPTRKKSTCSNTADEDDISNIPSLQTRIQIISQRLGIPADMPIELI